MKALDLSIHEPGSTGWHKDRLGVVTASRVSEAIAKKGTATRAGYMAELIGQIATGEYEEITSKYLEWGKINEAPAISAYEFSTGNDTEKSGLIYGMDRRIGCTPDALVKGKLIGVENKCPFTPKVHVEFLTSQKIKPEYLYQIQFGMFVTGFEEWHFCSFHPKFKAPGTMFKAVTIERDNELMERFANEIGEFVLDMDKELLKLNLTYGSQWL